MVLNNSPSAAALSLPIATTTAIHRLDANALADGTVLEDLLNEGAPPLATLTAGELPVNFPPKTGAIYRPRSSHGASAVTFLVRADTSFGERLYVGGDVPELGAWDPTRAILMAPSRCAGRRRSPCDT